MKIQARKVVAIYIFAAIVSFIYIIYYQYYNGDFIKKDVSISTIELTVISIFTVLPILYVYWLFTRFCRNDLKYSVYSLTIIRNISWIIILLHICLRITGYGTMGSDSVSMSTNPISIIKAVLFKIPVLPWIVIYVLGSNYRKGILITIVLFCIFSICHKSLGGIFTSALLLIYRYPNITHFFKRHILLTAILILLAPSIITASYKIRDTLRSGTGMAETTSVDFIAGKLCGRLCSLSNNAYIYQNFLSILAVNNEIPPAFYYYDPLHYFGIRPEFKSTGSFVEKEIKHGKDENYSTMAGIGGVMVISAVKGPMVFCINLLFVLLAPYLLFSLVHKMRLKNASGIALFLSIWFAVNGDSSDIANNIYFLIFIWCILQFCKKKREA